MGSTPSRGGISLTRLIVAALIGSSLCAIAVVSTVVWVLVTAHNDAARQSLMRLADLSLQEQIHKVRHTAESYAHAYETYTAVTSRDLPRVFRLIGATAASRGTFDRLYTASWDNEPIYGFRRGASTSDIGGYPDRVVAQQIARIRTQTGHPRQQGAVGVERVDGRLMIVVTLPIYPAEGLPANVDPPPLLVAMSFLESGWLGRVTRNLVLGDSTVAIGGLPLPQPGRDVLPLRGANGEVSGALTWASPTPGFAVLRDQLPAILGMCLVLLAGGAFAAFGAGRLASHVVRQRQAAQTDSLTGLPNRGGLEAAINAPDAVRAINAGELGVLYIDLNHFKELNDSEGHEAGDLALKKMAHALRSNLREYDMPARVGGDEFVCLIRDRNPQAACRSVAQRLMKTAEEPLYFGNRAWRVIPAIGISVAGPNATPLSLIRDADEAMYATKRSMRRGIRQDPVLNVAG